MFRPGKHAASLSVQEDLHSGAREAWGGFPAARQRREGYHNPDPAWNASFQGAWARPAPRLLGAWGEAASCHGRTWRTRECALRNLKKSGPETVRAGTTGRGD